MADITPVLRRPDLVSDERLRRNIVECLQSDAYCGPSVEKITQASGLEFEQILKDKLAQLGCDIYDGAFFDEVHLKHAGMHKTPDILLTIPICVKGKAVHWIDSKALFCDVPRFELMYKRQLGGYEARYGAGMVVFWFGYCEGIHDCTTSQNITVVSDFPDSSEITTYPESERALLDYAAMTSAISHNPQPPPYVHTIPSGSKRELFGDAVVGFGSVANSTWPPPSTAKKA